MGHVLITQIGRPRKQGDNEYELTTYDLNGKTFETAMIGYGLVELIKPDRLVLLGTTGSAWSKLISMRTQLLESEPALALHDKLAPKELSDDISNEDLEPLARILSEELQCPVTCQLTPYLETDTIKESAQFMQTMAQSVEHGDSITLDITHGLRHHPMLALVAAQYLRTTLSANIVGIYYGMFERKQNNIAPVISLEGMLNLIDWVTALNSFDKDGDYSIFSNLMKEDGIEPALANGIAKAGFHERSNNSVQAREQLINFRQTIFSPDDTPLTHLFGESLNERVAWTDKPGRGNRELQLARQYLKRRDYLRACIFAFEGTISKSIDLEKQQLNDRKEREEHTEKLSKNSEFKELKLIRHALAHGAAAADGTTKTLLQDEEKLKAKIASLIKKVDNLT